MIWLRVVCVWLANALWGSLWGELMWWLFGPGLMTALLAGFGGVVIGLIGMSLALYFGWLYPMLPAVGAPPRPARCARCYGDTRAECIRVGRCVAGERKG